MNWSKYTEREFWLALAPLVVGILITVGVIGPDSSAATQVTGAIVAVGPVVAYIVMRVMQKINVDKGTSDVTTATLMATKSKPVTVQLPTSMGTKSVNAPEVVEPLEPK